MVIDSFFYIMVDGEDIGVVDQLVKKNNGLYSSGLAIFNIYNDGSLPPFVDMRVVDRYNQGKVVMEYFNGYVSDFHNIFMTAGEEKYVILERPVFYLEEKIDD